MCGWFINCQVLKKPDLRSHSTSCYRKPSTRWCASVLVVCLCVALSARCCVRTVSRVCWLSVLAKLGCSPSSSGSREWMGCFRLLCASLRTRWIETLGEAVSAAYCLFLLFGHVWVLMFVLRRLTTWTLGESSWPRCSWAEWTWLCLPTTRADSLYPGTTAVRGCTSTASCFRVNSSGPTGRKPSSLTSVMVR